MSMMPALSPGSCTSSLLRVGSRFRCTRDGLYEQCSLHITLKMPSSVSDGSRPSDALIRSYSSGVMPCSAMTSGVMAEACVIVDIIAISILAFSNIHHLADIQSHVAQAPRLRLPEHSIPLWHRRPRLCSPVLKTAFRCPDRQITRSHLRRASRPYPPSSSQIIPVWRRVQRFTHDWRRVPFAPPTPTPYVDPIRTKVTQLDPILRASAEGRTITKQRDAITDIPQPV